jgi:hypothetical protein
MSTRERTVEKIERRLNKTCKKYLKGRPNKKLRDEIIELAKRLDELKSNAGIGQTPSS